MCGYNGYQQNMFLRRNDPDDPELSQMLLIKKPSVAHIHKQAEL